MSNTLTLKPAGLYTYYNQLAEVPNGGLLDANNTVIQREGVAELRRGIKYYSEPFGTSIFATERSKQLFEYKGRILMNYSPDKLAFDNGSGLFTDFTGTYISPSSIHRMKSLETKGNLYFTTSEGVKKISATNATDIAPSSIMDTGVPAATGGRVQALYGSGFVPPSKKCAYKTTWAYKDANNLLIEGEPSNAIVFVNESTIYATPRLVINIPQGITTSYIFRVYRSELKNTTETLSEEYNLVFEGNPTSLEITSKEAQYDDQIPEEFRLGGIPLYTNQISGQGVQSTNNRPPLAVDLGLFNNHVFYANTKERHYSTTTMISVENIISGISKLAITDNTSNTEYTFYGSREQSQIRTQAKTLIPDESFFLLNSANNERRYYVWFDKTGDNIIPSSPQKEGRIPLRIDISSETTDVHVANKMVLEINTYASIDFTASIGSQPYYVIIDNKKNGVTDATANSVDAPTTCILTTLIQGEGEDLINKKILLEDNLDSLSNIEITAKSLVNVINYNYNEIVTAEYISGLNGNPGQILFKRKSLADVPFWIVCFDSLVSDDFSPKLPVAIGSGPYTFDTSKMKSVNDTQVNGLRFSKQDEPEHCPISNQILVGASDSPILRIQPLRESLFIFKSDGLFRLTGFSSSDFTVQLFDNTAILKAPDSVAVLNNQIYYYGSQGIARVSEAGVEIISKPIQDKVLPFITTNSNLASIVFSTAYETDRSYLLHTVRKNTDTWSTVCLRFNCDTNTWVNWNVEKTCAVLNSDQDMMYWGSAIINRIEVERKNFNRFDYCDREIDLILPTTSVEGAIIRPTGASNVEEGDVIVQTQYLTISQFNQILRMMDSDIGFLPGQSFTNFSPVAGDELGSRIAALVLELNLRDPSTFTDTHGNTAYVYSNTTDFVLMQDEWNKIVDRLNQSPNVFFSNYPKSIGTVPIEALVISKNLSNNEITLNLSLPYIEGPLVVYKAIDSSLEYTPQHGGDQVSFKQFSTAVCMFEYRSFITAQLGFSSDLSTDFDYIQFYPNSGGVFGGFLFGEGAVWGGLGDKAPLRTYIPRQKQRSRFIGAKFKHKGALESFSLYGIAITYSAYSDRAYR